VRAQELVVGLAPTAVAAAAMGPGGGAPPPKQGRLTGRPAKPGANEKNPENLRAAARENESARTLADNGYDVEQLRPGKGPKKSPDYRINGECADCYAPKTNNSRSIMDTVSRKVNEGQADRIILNLDDSQVTLEALRRELLENPITGLKQLIVLKDKKVILFHP
jgi:hypothetical protein